MSDPRPRQVARGLGTLLVGQHARAIPVFYALTLGWEAGGDGSERLSISGRLRAAEAGRTGTLAMRHARVLVLDDGRRFAVWLRDAEPDATSLAFTARPLDGSDFPAE